jgi:Sulfotransferase family
MKTSFISFDQTMPLSSVLSESSTARRRRIPSLVAPFVWGCAFALTMAEFSTSHRLLLYSTTTNISYETPYYSNTVARGTESVQLSIATDPNTTFVAITRPSHQPLVKSYDSYWLVASKTKQVAVTVIPKVMCSSIRSVMNGIECRDTENKRCAEARQVSSVAKLPLQNYTRVVFFRDPLERALSTYKNSETNRYIQVEGCQKWKSCSFDYWVDRLVDFRSTKNEHFLPQAVISQRDKMHYHHHLRISNQDHVDFFFRDLLGKEPVVVNKSSNSKTGGTNSSTATEAAGDAELIQQRQQQMAKKFQEISEYALIRLLLLYEDDFKLWEYMLASSPRGPDEYTMYDYYKEYLEEGLREKLMQERLRFQRSW